MPREAVHLFQPESSFTHLQNSPVASSTHIHRIPTHLAPLSNMDGLQRITGIWEKPVASRGTLTYTNIRNLKQDENLTGILRMTEDNNKQNHEALKKKQSEQNVAHRKLKYDCWNEKHSIEGLRKSLKTEKGTGTLHRLCRCLTSELYTWSSSGILYTHIYMVHHPTYRNSRRD